jgi:Fe-S-cluster-containing dehydrogenase component
MTRYAMAINVDRCTGCYACFLACRDEFTGNDYPPHSLAQPATAQNWIAVKEIERGTFPKVKVSYIPVPCQNCAAASCIDAGRDGAVYRRDDGIVMIDPEKAKGQKEIASSCPYGVIFWNAEQNVAQKCTFCAHLLDNGGDQPRCAEACPVDAIEFGDVDDKNSVVAEKYAGGKGEALHPEFKLKPTVSYIGLPKKLVAGEVVLAGDPEECLKDVTVTLTGQAGKLSTVTDAFGDFEFDGLESDTDYILNIEESGFIPVTMKILTETDICLGAIVLGRAG